jgi:hypothetical protein
VLASQKLRTDGFRVMAVTRSPDQRGGLIARPSFFNCAIRRFSA